MPNIITLNCACYGGGATVHAPVFQTGVRAQVDLPEGNPPGMLPGWFGSGGRR